VDEAHFSHTLKFTFWRRKTFRMKSGLWLRKVTAGRRSGWRYLKGMEYFSYLKCCVWMKPGSRISSSLGGYLCLSVTDSSRTKQRSNPMPVSSCWWLFIFLNVSLGSYSWLRSLSAAPNQSILPQSRAGPRPRLYL